jgi:hypothetical protein
MNYLIKNLMPCVPPPSIINSGTKIIGLTWKGVKCIDSYCFLPIPLDQFSKTFNLVEVKGYFPHFFNCIEHQNYIGSIPDQKYFGVKYFSRERREKFERWYAEVKDVEFNFKDSFFSYCEADVDVLAKGCFKFRDIIMSIADIDPFANNYTIASLCHSIYRKKYMPLNSIGVIAEYGYNPHEKSSRKAMQWLAWLESDRKIEIKYHARSLYGEMKVGPYKLDGFIDNEHAYEFHGCLFHGCPKCYSGETVNHFTKEKMNVVHARHLNRINYLKKYIKIEEMWECEWDSLCKSKLAEYLASNEILSPLEPRSALYGGRTEAFVLHYLCKDNERIMHYDIRSLYAWVEKYCRMPVGHCRIITSNFENIENYFGIIKCRILPPKKLLYPVLPCRSNNKLVFALCSKCSELRNTNKCTHSDLERSFVGTWCSPEVMEAINQNYRLIRVYEVWHWEKSVIYDKASGEDGLFSNYINAFLKLKQESSGWPSWVESEEDRDRYIHEFQKHEGISLDRENISFNSGMRHVSKLCLTSHWGRFGMQTNKSKIRILTETSEWYNIINNDNYVVHGVLASTPDIIQVSVSDNVSLHVGSFHNSVPLAAFVTTFARLKLLESLVKVGRRALYTDTDSIIFVVDDNFFRSPYMIKTGDFLGDWADEILTSYGENVYIKEFVSAGPKNYTKRFSNGVCVSVVKGFALTSTAACNLNFDSIKRIVMDFLNEKKGDSLFVEQSSIKRSKETWEMKSIICNKEYNMVYDKRVINYENFTTDAFGTMFD